jgi:hypothetical protein
MIPQPTDFFLLFELDHSQRETTAASERARTSRRIPASVPPRTTRLVHRPHHARAG